MIDEVAACYGIRLGYWSRIRLLRMIGQHMLYAGAAELITDVGLDWLGAELSARLSARLAQGVGAGAVDRPSWPANHAGVSTDRLHSR